MPPQVGNSGIKRARFIRKVAISGQDADLAGIKRIAAGTQTMTVYKPITLLANTAAEIAVELGNGQEPKADTSLNNGLKDVPSAS